MCQMDAHGCRRKMRMSGLCKVEMSGSTDGRELKGGFAMQCDKNEYRGILAGLEGVTGKKNVNSETMTVKNKSCPYCLAGKVNGSLSAPWNQSIRK
jgi:hypothetical protein